jgi:predicted DNA-binding transcriptional regulator YafY
MLERCLAPETRAVADQETTHPVQFPHGADDRRVLDSLQEAISGKGGLAIDTTHERTANDEQSDRRKQDGNRDYAGNTHSHLRPWTASTT